MNSPSFDQDLPIIGPATNCLVFPKQHPELALKNLEGAARMFVEAEMAIARCDFAQAKELVESLLRDDHYILAAVRIGVITAIGLNDNAFLADVLKALADYRQRNPHRYSALGVEIMEAWLKQWLWIATGYPEWMYRFDLSHVPEEWRQVAAYIGMKIRISQGNFESAYAASSLLVNFVCPKEGISAECAYAKIACAIACRETGRQDEMRKWIEAMVRLLVPHGFLLPLVMLMHGPNKSVVEESIEKIAPERLPRYKDESKRYFKNQIRIRNHHTGEKITQELTLREFYLAMLLKRGMAYKELADRFGVSVGRLRNLVSNVYEKLGIHSRSELDALVW